MGGLSGKIVTVAGATANIRRGIVQRPRVEHRLLHRDVAVDGERGACDAGGFLGGEKCALH